MAILAGKADVAWTMAARARVPQFPVLLDIRARSAVLGNCSSCGPLIYICHLRRVPLTYVPTHALSSFILQLLVLVRSTRSGAGGTGVALNGTIHDA